MLSRLITNHADAWGSTLIICALCVALHDALTLTGVVLVLMLASGYWLSFALNDWYDAPYDAQDARKAGRNPFVVAGKNGRHTWRSHNVDAVGTPFLASAQSTPTITSASQIVFDPSASQLTAETDATRGVPTNLRRLQVVALAFVGFVSVVALAFFATFGGRGVVVFGVAYAVMWVYSAPPLRLKSRPGFDLLVHALFVQTFPYAVCLYLLDLRWQPLDGMAFGFFVLASLSSQLEQQARDYDLDSRTERTFTTVVGLRANALILRLLTAVLIGFVCLNIAYGSVPLALVPLAVICLPVLLHRLVRAVGAPRSEWLFRVTLVVSLAYVGWVLWRG